MRHLKRKKDKSGAQVKRPLREVGLFLIDILYNAAVIITLVVVIRTFLISPFRVIGSSMADTLVNNEFILIDKLSYHLGEPKRGDPVVFLPPITNKYPYKFQESVTTDDEGNGLLQTAEMITDRQVFYCQNPIVKQFWFCKDKVRRNDVVYYRPIHSDDEQGVIDLSWKESSKKLVSDEEAKSKSLKIEGKPNQSYIIRIYNSTGPEYFVKRVIGVPGDTVRIDNGRVYLSQEGQEEFKEIEQPFLNDENRFNTYFQKFKGDNEFKVPVGHYFVLGDNRNHSNDSRHWFSPIDESRTPFVSEEDISGRVLIVLWPPDNLRLLPAAVLTDE